MKYVSLAIISLLFTGLTAWTDELDPLPIRIQRDPAEKAWVDGQNARTQGFLNTRPDLHSAIAARSNELQPQNPAPRTNFQGREFYTQKGSLFVVEKTGDRMLVDVAKLAPGSAVADFRLSPDGKKLAYGISRYGNDWQYWQILDLDSAQMLDGRFYFKNIGATPMVWNTDSNGLYYPNSLTAEEDQSGVRRPGVKFHELGTDVKNDQILFEDPQRVILYNVYPIDAKTAVVFRTQGSAEVPLFIYLLKRDGSNVTSIELLPPGRHWGRFLAVNHGKILVRSSLVGSRYGIVAIDSQTLRQETIVEEHPSEVLNQAQQIGDKLVLQYLDPKLNSKIRIHALDGKLLREVNPSEFGMGNLGTLSTLTGDSTSLTGDFTYSTATEPTETIRFDVNSMQFTKLASKPLNFDASRVKLETRHFRSADWRDIPVFVLTRTDLASPPTFAYLYAYGNIGSVTLPSWNKKYQLALELGGMVAIAVVRGGGEFGLEWQQAGVFDKKATLQDLVEASRWLKANFQIKDGNVNVSGRSFGGMNTLSLYTHNAEDFTSFTPVVSISDAQKWLKADGWWAADDLGFKRNPATGELIFDREHEKYISEWNPLTALPSLKSAKPIFVASQQYDFRVGARESVSFVKPALAQFGDSASIYLAEYGNGSHTGRAETNGDEATFLALIYSIPQFLPLVH